MKIDFKNEINSRIKRLNISISEESIENLEKYFNYLLKIREKVNLTGHLNELEIVEYLFADSLIALKYLNFEEGTELLDIGTGAGFPGLALKIARPEIKLTLLDSSQKKIDFLKNTARMLNLSNINFIQTAVEEAGKNRRLREEFDIVTSKAFAEMPLLLELCSCFVKTGGELVSWKGKKYKEEIEETGLFYKELGLNEPLVTKEENLDTFLIRFVKSSPTPDTFPRKIKNHY